MLRVNRLNSTDADFTRRLKQLRQTAEVDEALTARVRGIIKRVQRDGDRALLEYTRELDRFTPSANTGLRVSAARLRDAASQVSDATLTAIKRAAWRIRRYAERQKMEEWSWDEDGIKAGQIVTPIDAVGLYIPGGKAAYPSSTLMTAIPAQVAGVSRIAAVSSASGGEINTAVLAALQLCGVSEVYRISGAQAIAALAYGTETIMPVDKIAGPGNRYVTEAKRQVFGHTGIDMIAGPSEIVIVTDGSSDSRWLATDLFAQAEHDELAQAILISDQEECLNEVARAIEQLLPAQPRAEIIRKSLSEHGFIVKVRNLDEAAELVNQIAPEHLQLMVKHPDALLPGIRNAGAIFLGPHACEVLGDYCAGPSHVLPTAGAARFSSPLGVSDFQKRSSVVQCTVQGAAELSAIAQRMAEDEGLFAHADSARLRQPRPA